MLRTQNEMETGDSFNDTFLISGSGQPWVFKPWCKIKNDDNVCFKKCEMSIVYEFK